MRTPKRAIKRNVFEERPSSSPVGLDAHCAAVAVTSAVFVMSHRRSVGCQAVSFSVPALLLLCGRAVKTSYLLKGCES